MADKPKPQRINAELIYYQLEQINKRLDGFELVFVTKQETGALKVQIEDLRKDLQESKDVLTAEIQEIKRQRNLWGWLSPTLTAIVTALFTYITIEFFKNKG